MDTQSRKPPLLVIVGPTTSGKSALAVELARKFKGEVISADSRQVYRGLDIGSGKVTKGGMRGVLHHLIDTVNLRRVFTVADFKRLAERKIEDISRRGRVPIICGGTGFYIYAVIDDMTLPEVPPNTKLRKQLSGKSRTELAEILEKLDPRRIRSIDTKNPVRLIRAIEIAQSLGAVPRSKTRKRRYNLCIIGLNPGRAELKKKIHDRLMLRLKRGLIGEVKNLREEKGLSWKRLEELGLEYRYVARYLRKKLTKKEMISELEREIENYAKRQVTWFKRDKRIAWIDSNQEAERLVKDFLGSKF